LVIKNDLSVNAILEFNPMDFTPRTLALITLRAQEWRCLPSEAVRRLLDELVTLQKEGGGK